MTPGTSPRAHLSVNAHRCLDNTAPPKADGIQLTTEQQKELADLHRLLNKKAGDQQKNDFYFDKMARDIHLPKIIAEIGANCRQGNLPAPDLMSNCKIKTGIWFRSIMHLHFAGRPTERYCDQELGITEPGEYGINDIHRSIFQKLRECHGARTSDDYQKFMDWFIHIDVLNEFPNEEVLNSVHHGFNTLRPELCGKTTDVDAKHRLPFDPNCYTDESFNFKYRYAPRFSYLKFFLLLIMLKEAPPELTIKTVDSWLNGDDTKHRTAREWLFKQQHYPINTFFTENCHWNLLIEPLTALFPKTLDTTDHDLIKKLTSAAKVSISDEYPKAESYFMAFGRTLKTKKRDYNTYLKLQSKNESDDSFIKKHHTLKVLEKRKSLFKSECVTPEKIMRIENTATFLAQTSLTKEEQDNVLKMIKESSLLALEFTTPINKPYEKYNYDVENPDDALAGLRKYAQDYGMLWRKGVMGPASITAFHHFDRDRKHITLTPAIKAYAEGVIESHLHLATNYPNVGGKPVGMRDMEDILTLDDINLKNYFNGAGNREKNDSQKIRLNELARNAETLIRLNELARNAEGLILLYARRFNKDFDHLNPKSVKKIADDTRCILTDIFSSAMPLSQRKCKQLIKEHDLLDQAAREISYYLAHDVPYVKDYRAAEINRTVYPHLPGKMRSSVMTENMQQCLSDDGFRDLDHPGPDNHPQLGAPSGRMPLIALNAIITKFLSYGAVEIIKQHQKQKSGMPPAHAIPA